MHGTILSKHSEYFQAAAKPCYKESGGELLFDNIDPKYFALFLGVAYSYSSIVPHAAPYPAYSPEAQVQRTPLRDYVEVYKLCDRFICPTMASYMLKCIKSGIGDRHRALFRSAHDDAQQLWCMKDFADAFETLEMNHSVERALGDLIIEYFCEGIYYKVWQTSADEVEDKPLFVLRVSRYFADKLCQMMEQRSKLKRKELKPPSNN